jgi:large subunit ribosomal protein L29
MLKCYQIKEMTTEDLKNTLHDSVAALENYRFQHSSGQLENYKGITNTKREIARIKTVLRERESETHKKNLKK